MTSHREHQNKILRHFIIDVLFFFNIAFVYVTKRLSLTIYTYKCLVHVYIRGP